MLSFFFRQRFRTPTCDNGPYPAITDPSRRLRTPILLSVNHVTSRHSLVSGKVSIELQPTWPRFDVEFKEKPLAGLRRPPFTESSIG